LAFAKALAQLMDDPDRRRAMGAFGRHRIETKLAWHYSIPNLLKAYQKVLARPVLAEPQVASQTDSVCPAAVSSRQAAV
jgi:hypothetical protein